jgi:hypothetical protein
LEQAAALAALKRAELVALFVEDVDLIRLAGLPFAREVDRVSAVARDLDGLSVHRTLRAQAEQVRRALEQTAARRQLQASLQVVRGRYVREALSAAAAMDVLFLGRVGNAAVSGVSASLPGRGRDVAGKTRTPGPVLVRYDGSPCAERALAVARDLLTAGGEELVVMLPAAEPEVVDALWLRAKRALGAQAARFALVASADPADILRRVRLERCGLLVLPWDEGLPGGRVSHRFFEEVECPVVLITGHPRNP